MAVKRFTSENKFSSLLTVCINQCQSVVVLVKIETRLRSMKKLNYRTSNFIQSVLHKKLECGPMPNVMAAQPNIGGALCESSVITFLVRCHKLSLMPTAWVPCSNAANIEERKTWMQSEFFYTWQNSIMGQEPPKMYYSVPLQQTAKHHTKFRWLPLSDVAAVTLPRRKTRWNL